MAWQPTIYLLPVVIAATLSLLLAVIVGRRSDSLAHTFAVLMLATGLWALSTTLEFSSTSPESQLFWNRMEFFGAVVVPTAWFLLTLQYAGYESWLTRRTVGALVIEPGLVLAFVWTNETPLQHGSGLGFWLVHWIVTASGGELRFEENDPRGSVVTLCLERACNGP